MSKDILKKINYINNWNFFFSKIFPLIIIIFSVLYFYFIKSDFTAFQQNTHTFIPGLEFQSSDDIDFYTSSILESPKITLIYLINLIFSDWYFGIYFFKVFLNLAIYPCLWLLILSILKHKLNKESIFIDKKFYLIIFIFFILFMTGFLRKFQGPGSANGPLGYGSIQYLSDFNSMHLSFIIGMCGIIFALNKSKIINSISIITIFFSTIIHPAMGLNNLIILFLFYTNNTSLRYLKKFIYFSIVTVLIPVIILKFFFPADNLLSGKEFFDIYVNFRHPHHYLVSDKVLNIPFLFLNQSGEIKINLMYQLNSFIVWSTFFTILLFISIKYIKKMFLFNSLIFLIFHAIPLIQYFFVEKFHIKIFIELGITRFTTLLSIILFVQIILNVIFFYIKKNETKDNKFNSNKKFLKSKLSENLIYIMIISFVISKITYVHPLNDIKFEKYHPLVSWVKNNIKDRKELIVENQTDANLTNFLRVYGKQKIFYDKEGFPFSPKYIKEYQKRREFHNNFLNNYNDSSKENIDNNYKKMIGYLIIEKSQSKLIINQKNIIYEDNIFLIQKII